MQIVQGEYYKTRDGRKVGPMKIRDIAPEKTPWDASGEFGTSQFYRDDGIADDGADYDLISLWSGAPTSPVREMTKTIKEIVDGTYGRVFCYSIGDDPKKVAVAFVKRGEEGHADTPSFVLTEEELRAAAAVLLELAGALDN